MGILSLWPVVFSLVLTVGEAHVSSSSSAMPSVLAEEPGLTSSLADCRSFEEVLRIAEHIPALKRSNDKARRIVLAEASDAQLAAETVIALANLTLTNGSEAETWTGAVLETDRTFSQLLDCIELEADSLPLSELNKYIRALVSLGVYDEDHLDKVTEKYSSLTKESSVEDLVDSLWALASVRYTFERNSFTDVMLNITTMIASSLNQFNSTKFPFLHPSLSVKLMWSLAVNEIRNDTLVDFALSSLTKHVKYLSSNKCLLLFYALDKLEKFDQREMTVYLLTRLRDDLNASRFSVEHAGVIANALFSLQSHRIPDFEAKYSSYRSGILALGQQLVLTIEGSQSEDLSSITRVLRTAAMLNQTTNALWSITYQLSLNLMNQNMALKATDVALILESMAIKYSMGDEPHSSVPSDLLYLAGRLSVISTITANEMELSTLIDTCWAIAALGYPYQVLLRDVRKRAQFRLYELKPNTLVRLLTCVYLEEKASLSELRGVGAKFDRDFVNQVILVVNRRFNEIPHIHDRIQSLIAAASLGRISNSGEGAFSLELPCDQINKISTTMLVKLVWAVSRLKVAFLSESSLDAVRQELSTRSFFPESTLADTLLLVRAYCNCNARVVPDTTFSSLYSSSCHALLRHLEVLDSEGDLSHLIKSGHYPTRISLLCEAVRSFIDLEWFNDDTVVLVKKYLGVCESLDISSFNQGRLEELLKLYCSKSTERSGSSYEQAKQWLSKFLKNKKK